MLEGLRERLKAGDVTIGSWMQLRDPSVAEIMGRSGYDWVALDLEHGQFSLSSLPDLFRALESGDTLPLVRLALGDDTECKQVLDAGAAGVIVPMIRSAEHLLLVRSACCWPDAGTRGVGFSRANLFGKVPAWAGVLAFLVSRWLLLCFLVGFVLAVCLSLPSCMC